MKRMALVGMTALLVLAAAGCESEEAKVAAGSWRSAKTTRYGIPTHRSKINAGDTLLKEQRKRGSNLPLLTVNRTVPVTENAETGTNKGERHENV